MSLTTGDINRVQELILLSKKNNMFNMTTREFNEFKGRVLDVLHEKMDEKDNIRDDYSFYC